jgi:predicted secreted hydrolase
MSRRWKGVGLVVGLLSLLGYLALRMAAPPEGVELRTTLAVSDILGTGGEEGFARALEPRPFRFPRDHGPHPDYRTEWWYVTGNLEGPSGEAYGFQLTVFRSALAPEAPSGSSSWTTNQVFMGHFALTDVRGGSFRAFERFARGAQGLAGAEAEPFRVWLEDWVLEGPTGGGAARGRRTSQPGSASPGLGSGSQGIFPLRLTAGQEDRRISLDLQPGKPMVLQGDRGLSQKGPEPGNASYYYSFTRLEAQGTLVLGEEEIPVRGQAWLDREWSTSALSQGQVGWDWFALQLSDGRDLMYYQIRRADGTADPGSKGVLVGADGSVKPLTSRMVELRVLDRWESPRGGHHYPSRWRLFLPGEGLDLEIVPLLADQELNLTFRYWEGAVRVTGTQALSSLAGRGYVELTGYGDPVPSERARSMGRGSSPL